jgi:ubiquinone/menaquinone biosynthesis C-methylase UbiE
MMHHIFRLLLSDRLYISPLPSSPLHVLDIGTGTGIWAIDFATEHPSSIVTGVDLSPIQPELVPPNCSFIVDDAEKDWIYTELFDFIHARVLLMGIKDWPRLFKQSWANLRPGGWVEFQELLMPLYCDDESAPRDSPLVDWSHKLAEAQRKAGIDPQATAKFKTQLEEQGFVNVKYEVFKWAIGPWPKGEREKEIGKWSLENTLMGLHGITTAIFTRALNWSPEAVELFLVGVRKQMLDPRSHVYGTV